MEVIKMTKKALGIEICMKCGGMETLNEGIMTQIICPCTGKVDTATIKYNEPYGDKILKFKGLNMTDKELY